jgi:hypothetical protein
VSVAVSAVSLAARFQSRFRRLDGLPTIVFALVAFIQIFVLPPESPVGGALGQRLIGDSLADELSQRATATSVPTRGDELETLVASLPPPPLLVRGKSPSHWGLKILGDCAGPLTQVDAPAATLIYCVSADRTEGWVEVMGVQSTYGTPEILGAPGKPYARQIRVESALPR